MGAISCSECERLLTAYAKALYEYRRAAHQFRRSLTGGDQAEYGPARESLNEHKDRASFYRTAYRHHLAEHEASQRAGTA